MNGLFSLHYSILSNMFWTFWDYYKLTNSQSTTNSQLLLLLLFLLTCLVIVALSVNLFSNCCSFLILLFFWSLRYSETTFRCGNILQIVRFHTYLNTKMWVRQIWDKWITPQLTEQFAKFGAFKYLYMCWLSRWCTVADIAPLLKISLPFETIDDLKRLF